VSDDKDDKEKKLPTSADGAKNKKEEQLGDYVVEVPGGIVYYLRRPDGKLYSREFSTEELISDEAISDDDLRDAGRAKTIDLDTILAIQDIQEADKEIHVPVFNGAGTEEPRLRPISGGLELHFSQSDLNNFVAHRKTGLAAKSLDWIDRASLALWESTGGEISHRTVTALRESVLDKYTSPDSHSKVLSFAVGFLKFLAKTKMEPRYTSFELFLEMPRAVKERKSVTERIVTQDDIKNVLGHIKQAEHRGAISAERSAQYSAFVIFGAFTGQRSLATMAKLTVGQFREVLQSEKPALHVESSQDKIRMSHFVPPHPQVVTAVQPLLDGRKNEDRVFAYGSFLMWVKRQKIPMLRFNGHFVLGDLRKFCEQHGDIIQWAQSNRAYILTHGVSTVEWKHYRAPLPDSVYDIYMQYWGDVCLACEDACVIVNVDESAYRSTFCGR